MELNFEKAFQILGPSLLGGIGIVVYITVLGFLLALVVGMLLAIGNLSKNKLLTGIIHVLSLIHI